MTNYSSPVTLAGSCVTLAPLETGHAAELFAALNQDREIWQFLPTPMPLSEAQIADWVNQALTHQQQGTRVPFAVIENASGRAVGSTSYLDISEQHRHMEIGWTWYARRLWRSRVNTECKYLLLRHAFETLGCIRVQLKTDLRNERSQRAIERLGATREGTLRHVQLLYDGHQRSVVYYSLLAEEWPARKTWFERRLEFRGWGDPLQ